MCNFTESELEEAAIDLFEELLYETVYAPEISPEGDYPERDDYNDVILKERLKKALYKINEKIPAYAIEEAIKKIITPQSPDLYINNKEFHKMITEGIDVQYKRSDDSVKTDKVWLFDFENEDNNNWLCANQFTVKEYRKEKRPDLVVFVNGIPLSVIELKSSSDEDVGLSESYIQLQNYKNDIPTIFIYNQFLVISDGINARAGTITSDEDRFMMWRTIDGDKVESLSVPQLEVLIKGMFQKSIFLNLIRHFILFQKDGDNIHKILAGYHQYYAVNKAIESTNRALEEKGDRKIGVIWHTQGAGKSFTMLFYTGKLVLSFDNPTIVILTDRNDLDNQLFTTFSRSTDFLRQTPKQAEDRRQLREFLSVEAGGIIFTTIQKFLPQDKEETLPVLTNRKNVIVIADEAHRSQYGFNAEIITKEINADIKYGYAKYMRDSLPYASFIGFTGTPVELVDKNTPVVFGDYIDIYNMSRAVEDGTTVKIFYESRIAKLDLPDEEKPIIDGEFEEITEDQEEYIKEKQKSKGSSLEAIAGTEKRIKLIAQDIIEHLEKRRQAIFGKAMIVVMSRRIAVELYKEIIKLKPTWHSINDNEGSIKIVMTGSAADSTEWQPFITNKSKRNLLANRMKNISDPLKIVIVCDMWLTGFDVPCMDTMYIDKPMSGHNLMQAIARVNRVFRDKPGGLIVDYMGIAEALKNALAKYSNDDRQTTGVDTSVAANIMLEKYELIKDILYPFDYSKFLIGNARDRLQSIVETVNYILGLGENVKKEFIRYVTEIEKAYALCATTDEAQKLNIEIGFFKAVKSGIIKIIPDGKRKKTKGELEAQINQLVSKSVISEEVIDLFEAIGVDKPNIAILSDKFLEEVKGIPQKNLAIELLKRLIENKVKIISKKNLIQSKKFSDMLEKSIKKYQNRAIETAEIVLELIELAKEMNEMHRRGEDLGLTEDELAFYDALGTNDAAVKIMGDEILKQIARDLTKTIKNNLGVDWAIRESVRAKMRITIKHLLKKYKYPPDKQEQAVKTVMEQAKLMCEEKLNNGDELEDF